MAILIPPCIVCSKELKPVFEDDEDEALITQPNHAVSFWGEGNYGSIFDTQPDEYRGAKFIIQICDDCLKTAIEAGKVLTMVAKTKVVRSYKITNLDD